MLPPTTVIAVTHGLEPALSVFPALLPWWQLLGPVYSLSSLVFPIPRYAGCAGHLVSEHGGVYCGPDAHLKVQEHFELMLTLPGERFAIFEYDSFFIPVQGWEEKMREVLLHDGLAGAPVPFSLDGGPGEPSIQFPWFVSRHWLEKLCRRIQAARFPNGHGCPDRMLGIAARECRCPLLQLSRQPPGNMADAYLPGTVIDPVARGYAAVYPRMWEKNMMNILRDIANGVFIFHGMKVGD